MHLKSLVLKGFKSFADRSVLSLEPGITAIVGPNGSGKSNISDAVLWVLGERNARNLRGQAMEDVIFSGSSARKPVSVAEVELVLDNSAGELPIEFDEVSIARRMYRTGESEYLINSTVCRRIDVLDILHDTGLGTGTHSIISQGSLDSILQSKPEDRRTLIEEAAGVLKHKQRKEKSARKLEKMDNHLARVRDVSAEIERQLGPLERKAKRAIAYESASKELEGVRVSLAVDDLRRLQRSWNELLANEGRLSEDVETKRAAVTEAEKKAAELSELIRMKSVSAGELAKSQRAATALAERLESVEMLVREKRQAAREYEADLDITLQSSIAHLETAKHERAAALEQLDGARVASDAARAEVERITAERGKVAEERRTREASARRLADELRETQRKLDDLRRRRESLKEGLSAGLAHERIVEARLSELSTLLDRAKSEADAARTAASAAQDELVAAESRSKAAGEALSAAFAAREKAHEDFEAARAGVSANESETQAIKRAQRAYASDDPALIWVLDHAKDYSSDPTPLASAIGAPVGLESLIERLLSDDLSALMVDDAASARNIAQGLFATSSSGDVTLVLKKGARAKDLGKASTSNVGTPLVELLNYPASAADAVCALLGDVVVCESLSEAFAAYEADTAGLTYISRDGCAIGNNGRVRLFGKAKEEGEGVLARERRLAELADDAKRLANALAEAKSAMESADSAYQEAQEASLKLGQKLAEVRGRAASLSDDAEKAAARMASITREAEDIEAQHEQAKRAVAELQPSVDSVSAEIEELENRQAELTEARNDAEDAVIPLRTQAGRLGEALNNARLENARLSERRSYAERMMQTRTQEIEQTERRIADARETMHVKNVVQARTEPLLAVFGELSRMLGSRIRIIEDAVADSQSSTSGIHASAAEARDAERFARDEFDKANSAMSELRVEKGRLEIMVDAAVKMIVEDCATPIDKIDEVPELDNRSEAEDRAFKLERRIKNMGVINPDAAEEYQKLKKRYDFFASQMTDMEDARKSLAKIVRIIDARMKDDFVNTFELVNKNFSATFSQLFPGGAAELVLLDPEHLETTGIEVKAQPRGKRITKMSLLSGGEKSLTAIALLFAIYRVRSTPFYILDEVEAALDDTNLRRLVSYIDSLRTTTQLLMITHQRRTMEMADVLFGVSMQEDGVTRVISQKLERALELAKEE